MKKKLIFLPVMLMTYALTGCNNNNNKPIYIEQWLENAQNPAESGNPSRFVYKDSTDSYMSKDYGLLIANDIETAVEGIKPKSTSSNFKSNNAIMRYSIHATIDKFEDCDIYVFDDGTLITDASYRKELSHIAVSYTHQCFKYALGEERVLSLYDSFKNRYQQIQDGRAAEHLENQTKPTIENFIAAMEGSEKTHLVRCTETNAQGHKSDYYLQDLELSYLADIKELEFNKLDSKPNDYGETIAEYYIDSEYALVFQNKPCNYVAVRYINIHSSYKEYSLYSQMQYYGYYSIDVTKGNALVDRLINKR